MKEIKALAVTTMKGEPLQPLQPAMVDAPPPRIVGWALATRSMLDAVQPLATEARAAVRRAEGHESHAVAVAKAERLEAASARLEASLREWGLFA